jgi:hypothetical protein
MSTEQLPQSIDPTVTAPMADTELQTAGGNVRSSSAFHQRGRSRRSCPKDAFLGPSTAASPRRAGQPFANPDHVGLLFRETELHYRNLTAAAAQLRSVGLSRKRMLKTESSRRSIA